MMLWQCHAAVKIEIPTKMEFPLPGLDMGMAKQNLGFWAMFFGLESSQVQR